jgi:hypothetical protein
MAGRSIAVLFADTIDDRFRITENIQKDLRNSLEARGFDVYNFSGRDILGNYRRQIMSAMAASRGSPLSKIIFAWMGHGGKAGAQCAHGFIQEEERGKNILITDIEKEANVLSPGTPVLLLIDACLAESGDAQLPPSETIDPYGVPIPNIAVLRAASSGYYAYLGPSNCYTSDFAKTLMNSQSLNLSLDNLHRAMLELYPGSHLETRLCEPFNFRRGMASPLSPNELQAMHIFKCSLCPRLGPFAPEGLAQHFDACKAYGAAQRRVADAERAFYMQNDVYHDAFFVYEDKFNHGQALLNVRVVAESLTDGLQDVLRKLKLNAIRNNLIQGCRSYLEPVHAMIARSQAAVESAVVKERAAAQAWFVNQNDLKFWLYAVNREQDLLNEAQRIHATVISLANIAKTALLNVNTKLQDTFKAIRVLVLARTNVANQYGGGGGAGAGAGAGNATELRRKRRREDDDETIDLTGDP